MITTFLMSLLGALPPLNINTPLKNHLFTNYPLGAYVNAAANPVFLYFRILKKKLSFGKSIRKSAPVRIAVHSNMALTAEKQTVLEKQREEESLAEVVAFNVGSDLRARLTGSMNSAHRLFRNFSRDIILETSSRISLKKKMRVQLGPPQCLVMENVRRSAVIMETEDGNGALSMTTRDGTVLVNSQSFCRLISPGPPTPQIERRSVSFRKDAQPSSPRTDQTSLTSDIESPRPNNLTQFRTSGFNTPSQTLNMPAVDTFVSPTPAKCSPPSIKSFGSPALEVTRLSMELSEELPEIIPMNKYKCSFPIATQLAVAEPNESNVQ